MDRNHVTKSELLARIFKGDKVTEQSWREVVAGIVGVPVHEMTEEQYEGEMDAMLKWINRPRGSFSEELRHDLKLKRHDLFLLKMELELWLKVKMNNLRGRRFNKDGSTYRVPRTWS